MLRPPLAFKWHRRVPLQTARPLKKFSNYIQGISLTAEMTHTVICCFVELLELLIIA